MTDTRLPGLRYGRLVALLHRRPEVWIRQDVAGHSLGCPGLPTQHGDHGPRSVACDCYASVWTRWPA